MDYAKEKEKERNKKTVAFIKQELERRANERMPYELQWQLNMNFFNGNQYCDAALPSGEIFQQEKQYYWQEREVFNHIAPLIEARLSRLSQVRPAVMVRPATGDESDVAAAEVSTDILHSAWRRLDMTKLISEATVWSELCGTAFYKLGWDKTAGSDVGGVYNGDVAVAVCSPFEIYPDGPEREGIEQCRSVIFARVYPAQDVKRIYGIDVAPGGAYALAGNAVATKNGWFTGRVGGSLLQNGVTVAEYYALPDAEHKNGQVIIVAGDTVVYTGELDGGILPFAQQRAIVKPGCFWGTSVIERCIPIQRAYNAVKNRKHEYLNRAAFGVLAVEDGAVDIRELEQDGLAPGKILTYRQGSDIPRILPVGQLPAEFAQEESALLQEFEMISGVSEMMRRSYGGSVNSGVAISLLNEQDNTRLAITSEQIRAAVLFCGKYILKLYKKHATLPRLISVTGENGSAKLKSFCASDITCDDVVHQTENELSDSLAQRRQMVFDLLSRGVFNGMNGMDGRTRARLLEMLGMGDWENANDLEQLQIDAAKRENEFLKKAETGVADDHRIHMNQHAAFILSEKFEQLDADRAEMIKQHYLQHKALLENGG